MRIAQIANQPVSDMTREKQAKLADAAQQFEAMMMQEMLKPLQAGQDGWGGDAQNDDAGADTMSSLGTEAVAKAIAKGGGLGIAKQVIRQVTQEGRQASAKKP